MNINPMMNSKKIKYLDQRGLFAVENTILLINNSNRKTKLALETDNVYSFEYLGIIRISS